MQGKACKPQALLSAALHSPRPRGVLTERRPYLVPGLTGRARPVPGAEPVPEAAAVSGSASGPTPQPADSTVKRAQLNVLRCSWLRPVLSLHLRCQLIILSGLAPVS